MLRHVIHTIILYVTHVYIIYGEYSHGVCTYAAHLLYGGSPRANGGGGRCLREQLGEVALDVAALAPGIVESLVELLTA